MYCMNVCIPCMLPFVKIYVHIMQYFAYCIYIYSHLCIWYICMCMCNDGSRKLQREGLFRFGVRVLNLKDTQSVNFSLPPS